MRSRLKLAAVFAFCAFTVAASTPSHPIHTAPLSDSWPSFTGHIDWLRLKAQDAKTDEQRFYEWLAQQKPRGEGMGAVAARQAQARYGMGACGGDLPPCSVLECESHGNLTAQNPRSTASGKWQVLDTTWRTEDTNGDRIPDSYQGYSRASDAPEKVQDARAREIYAGGAGRSAWVC